MVYLIFIADNSKTIHVLIILMYHQLNFNFNKYCSLNYFIDFFNNLNFHEVIIFIDFELISRSIMEHRFYFIHLRIQITKTFLIFIIVPYHSYN